MEKDKSYECVCGKHCTNDICQSRVWKRIECMFSVHECIVCQKENEEKKTSERRKKRQGERGRKEKGEKVNEGDKKNG